MSNSPQPEFRVHDGAAAMAARLEARRKERRQLEQAAPRKRASPDRKGPASDGSPDPPKGKPQEGRPPPAPGNGAQPAQLDGPSSAAEPAAGEGEDGGSEGDPDSPRPTEHDVEPAADAPPKPGEPMLDPPRIGVFGIPAPVHANAVDVRPNRVLSMRRSSARRWREMQLPTVQQLRRPLEEWIGFSPSEERRYDDTPGPDWRYHAKVIDKHEDYDALASLTRDIYRLARDLGSQ